MIYLSLGSNVGNKKEYIERAIKALNKTPGITVKKVSSFYETEPWGGVEQDSFYNIVAEIDTTLTPLDLLHICQSIENHLGRIRTLHWGPRTIDIDILLFDKHEIKTTELTIPHPFMEEREFVLAPLREIAPEIILPSGNSISVVRGEGHIERRQEVK